jgi:hypothetical protein
MGLSIASMLRLSAVLKDAGIPIDSVNSNKLVQPEKLQSQAQPLIDAFDGSPEADQKYLEQQKYINAHATVATTDQTAIIIQAVLKVLVKEIAVAQPTYIVPPTQVLVTKVQTEIDSAKPPG